MDVVFDVMCMHVESRINEFCFCAIINLQQRIYTLMLTSILMNRVLLEASRSGLSTTRVENLISGQMGYSQRIAYPLPDAQIRVV